MVRSDSDWKNQQGQFLNGVLATLSLVLAGVLLYLWWTGPTVGYLVIAVVLGGGWLIYFRGSWQPILYLLMAIVLLGFSAYVVVYGDWREPVVLAMLVLNVAISGLAVYLAIAEERQGAAQGSA